MAGMVEGLVALEMSLLLSLAVLVLMCWRLEQKIDLKNPGGKFEFVVTILSTFICRFQEPPLLP